MTTAPPSAYELPPPAQRLFLEHPAAPPCTVSLYLLTGPLKLDRLRHSLAKVVARHEILRTTFAFRAGIKVPLQVVHDQLQPTFDVIGCGAPDIQHVLGPMDQQARRPFDLTAGPLLRASVCQLDDQSVALQLACPAVIADATALANVIRELLLIDAGQEDSLPAEPLQYADFSAWANERVATEAPHALGGQEFWRAIPALAASRLPFERDQRSSFSEERIEIELNHRAIQRTMESLPVLPLTMGFDGTDVLFLTLYARLMTLFAAEGQITTRLCMDARCTEEISDSAAIGLYSQTPPFHISIDGSRPLTVAMEAVAASLRQTGSFLHDLPVANDRPSALGFEVLLTAEGATPQGVTVTPLHVRCGLLHCTLKLSVQRSVTGANLRAFFYYDASCFRQDDLECLARTFAALLQATGQGQGPHQPVDRLNCHAEEDRRRLIALCDTAVPIPAVAFHELFQDQATRTPNRPALVCLGESYSYGALSARANQVAHWLQAQGIRPRDRVGLYVGRSSATIVGLLGVLQAGAAYVPLLADSPRARIAYQLEAVGVSAVLTETSVLDQLPPLTVPVACLDRSDDALFAHPTSNLLVHVAPEDLAYVIYTSGSTGTPKGVGISHRSLVNYARSLVRRLALQTTDGLQFATVSTLAADLGNTCIFPALIAGGCIHVIPQEVLMDGRLFAQYCRDRPIDVLKITPSHLEMLLDTAGATGSVLPRQDLLTGGEPLRWDLCSRSRGAGTCRHFNHYGPTETTIGSLMYGPIEPTDPAQAIAATVPIGRPIDNTEIYVLGESGLPVPLGAPGELYIGGAGLAHGYVNEPQQTRERFIRHPYSQDPDARLYRTGDQVRHLMDGSVEFLGRLDRQIKIRGHRVEPGEIEHILRRHPAVRQAAVVLSEASSGAVCLHAFFVAARSP